MKHELFPHQAEAIAMLRRSLGSGHRRPMVQAPTGFGKTLLAATIVAGARAKGKRVTFTVPAVSLINQTVRSFVEQGISDIGVIQADHPMTDWSKPIQVASVQTLERRQAPPSDIVIVDEAHRWFEFYGKWMADPKWATVPFVGLSATPWTKGLGKHYDDLLIAATTADLIEGGYLSRFRVFAPSHPDLSKVRTVAGDYHQEDLGEVMNGDALVADAVQNWLQHGENRPTLCFAVDRAHAKHLQESFTKAGVSTGYIDAYTPTEEREKIAERFKRGDVRVVCNVGTLTTGVDWDVRCVILARPTKSEMLFTQIIGRGLRTAKGKEDCLIFDHSDTHARLGFVTDINHESLDDGRERQKAEARPKPLPRECSKCKFLMPPKMSTCAACGFKAQRQNEVEHQAGELSEFGIVRQNQVKADRAEKQRWWSSLLAIAQERNRKQGWAAHQYREKFGVWPRGLDDKPSTPLPEVVNYVRSRQIAFAKARGKAA